MRGEKGNEKEAKDGERGKMQTKMLKNPPKKHKMISKSRKEAKRDGIKKKKNQPPSETKKKKKTPPQTLTTTYDI